MEQRWILVDKERYYYHDVKLFRGRPKMNKDVAIENLGICQSIIDNNNLTCAIFFGTLLGAVRVNNFICMPDNPELLYVRYMEKIGKSL